ncbi:phosphate ABC transporter permease [Achromatium sp. WMS3]|nr:phosphate ABC transporter permease [Achromatium sp. WMS3]
MIQYAAITMLLVIMAGAYYMGRKRSLAQIGGLQHMRMLHSLPSYYGSFTAMWAIVPALILFGVWLAVEYPLMNSMLISQLPQETQELPADQLNLVLNDIRNLAEGNIAAEAPQPEIKDAADYYIQLKNASGLFLLIATVSLAIGGLYLGLQFVSPKLQARNQVERGIRWLMIICSTIAIFTTIGIVLSVLFEALLFFEKVPVTDFLFGLHWSPQIAIRADQAGSSGAFGIIPLFVGTVLVTFIAMVVAVPIGLLSALYLSEYASSKVRAVAKPVLEILAGIPTVVFGFFAALVVAPAIRDFGATIGLDVASESALAAGLVVGIMIIPFISSLSDDVINAVPQTMRDGSLALGATHSETIKRVIFPAALSGIVGSILLAVSRAIGETMIVVMSAGLAANLTANPLEAVTTVTVQIVTLLTGDQEFDSAKTLAAFALGLVLFIVTLILNIIALQVVRRYREQYE